MTNSQDSGYVNFLTNSQNINSFDLLGNYYYCYYYSNTGVCKINTRSENMRYDSQPPFPQISMLTKQNVEWIGVQNKHPIMLNVFGACFSTLNFGGTGAKLTL